MPEQSADNAGPLSAKFKFGQQVRNDVVVVARVECDFIASSALDHSPNNINRLIAIKGSDLNSDHVRYFGEFPPELVWQHTTAHRSLKIEANNRNHRRYRTRMLDHF